MILMRGGAFLPFSMLRCSLYLNSVTMYDNLDFSLSRIDCPKINLLEVIPQYMTAFTSQGESTFGQYVNGYLDTLKVKVSETGVKVYDSSICKYFLGNNFKTLSKGDTKRAIEKISDCLHLPFHLSNVTRIDFAQNIIMKHPEGIYYSYLGQAQNYKRLEQNNGLYYNNNLRQLLFYGKEYEQKVKKQPIPELYRDKNTLRFEMRFKKRLREQFKKPEITAQLLYDDNFYKSLMMRWRDEYLSIHKITSSLTSVEPTGSKKVFINNLALLSVLELGQAQILKKIEEWKLKGEISNKQAYDLRKATIEVGKSKRGENKNDIIEELDKKIKSAARYY